MRTGQDTQLAEGHHVGHYQLIQCLDKRAGIEIWSAQHIVLHIPVVLKILLPDQRDPAAYQRDERFLRNEARFLASLHHQFIIGYRDYLLGRDFRALVLERAPYGSVVRYHGQGRKLPLLLVRLYVAQVGRALHLLHQRKQIHRDVKPGNILLLNLHHAVLADFELAIDIPISGHMRKQYAGGTVPYMAPEQQRGAPCAASDQYSLAVCAYEWLTGHSPFQGKPEVARLRRMAAIPRSVRIDRPELPPAVDQIMWTALHPNPARRYPTVMAFARAFVDATRRSRPPLVRRLPYYRTIPWRDENREDEPPFTQVRLFETGEIQVPYMYG